ncbi:AAA family ATPase [uncultured Parasutterella sp.]|uniref:AAA family ATPase n=1 Tax=uncultured Parasutterella sp. TaxID=1263098 RepID=UPI0025967FD1|nr:AAA family ATPase [uncultured Parasutterella sp.]
MQQVFDDVICAEEFGFTSEQKVLGYQRESWDVSEHYLIPKKDPNYVFRQETLGIMSAWWEMGSGEPLFVSGPHGSGKTSFINQFCARVRAPVIAMTARTRLDRTDLIGHYVIDKDKSMRFVDGPLTRAWRRGFVFLVNEMSAAPGDLWLSVNELLEGAPLFIEATGEVIERHPRTRIVMTDNIRGLCDDEKGSYVGRFVQDPAVMDRCWKMRMDYMDADSEIALILSSTPEVQCVGISSSDWKREFAVRLRKSAERVREAYCGMDPTVSVDATISTRVLMRFRDLLLLSYRSKAMGCSHREAVRKALRISLTDCLDSTSASVIEKLVEAELGNIGDYLLV